jgi:hypothetical protein
VGAEKDLAHREGPAGYIAADKIGVHGLKPRGRKCAAGKDAVTETGSEALYLSFDAIGHVDGGTVGDVAVGPEDMLALRRARRVKERGLGGENERLIGMKAMGDRIFTGGDFFEGAAKVNCDGTPAGGGPPRHGLGEGIVDFEGAGRMFKGLNCFSVAGHKPVAGQGEQCARRRVAQGESVAGGQIAKGLCIDAAGRVNNSAEGLEMANQRARNGSGSSLRNWPSNRVGGGAQQHCGTRTEWAIEWEYGVSGEPGEQSPDANAGKASGEAIGRLHRSKTKARHKEGVAGNAQDRAERAFGQLIPAANESFDEPPPLSAICAEFLLCVCQAALQNDRSAVVEGVGDGRFSMHPFEPVIGQWKSFEKGRTSGQWVNG